MSVGESQRLTVTCPNCGKTGKLPAGVTTYPKNIKCSGCQTKFNPGAAALDAICVKEPEVYDLEQTAFQPVNWAPSSQAQVPVRQDPPPLPSVGVSTSTPTRPARMTRKLRISSTALLLTVVPLTIGATVLTMRFLPESGTNSVAQAPPVVQQADNKVAHGNISKPDGNVDPEALHQEGQKLLDDGENEQAAEIFSKEILLRPKAAEAHNSRGVAYLRQKRYAKALTDFNEAIRLDPKMPRYYSNRRIVYEVKNNYDLALADCNKCIEIAPDTSQYYRDRWSIYLQMKRDTEAHKDYCYAAWIDKGKPAGGPADSSNQNTTVTAEFQFNIKARKPPVPYTLSSPSQDSGVLTRWQKEALQESIRKIRDLPIHKTLKDVLCDNVMLIEFGYRSAGLQELGRESNQPGPDGSSIPQVQLYQQGGSRYLLALHQSDSFKNASLWNKEIFQVSSGIFDLRTMRQSVKMMFGGEAFTFGGLINELEKTTREHLELLIKVSDQYDLEAAIPVEAPAN